MVFYDGRCGLCHRTVKFALRHDPTGSAFRFAPLQGATFRQRVPDSERAAMPDSVVVLTGDNRLLTKSDVLVHILGRLGGRWRVLARIAAVIPRRVLDGVYDFIARRRYGVFGKRDELCPVVPADLRARFDP